ncbi:MAG: sensor histidine kinase [Burkholderiales bacterium]|nr:sensor histidine kinase [Burkholderiales bacterium]
MKRLFAPSLARRMMMALLVAFALAWVVLLAFEYMQEGIPSAVDGKLAAAARGLALDLSDVTDTAEARATVAVLERTINRNYHAMGLPAVLVVQLRDSLGQIVHGAAPWSDALAAAPVGLSQLRLPGQPTLHAYRSVGPHWTVTVAQTEVPRAWVLKSLGSELALYMAIALPCVLLPLWLAVSQGLRPLHRLSRAVAARDSEDMSATGLIVRHRELQPLVGAIDGLLSRLRVKVERERAFIHDAAHELRTPMAVISAQAHALARAPDEVRRREAEECLDESLARAARLVDQLLALAHLDDSPPAQCEPVDASLLAQQELAQLAPRAIADGLELDLDAPETLKAAVEPLALRTVLRNLVGNALRYVPRGGRVQVSLAAEGNGLRLVVADDGPGIAPEDRERVFERFVRGSASDVPGSGLGLAIVRQAARRTGGEVLLSTGLEGRGCRFEVRLRGAGPVAPHP